MKTKRMLSLLLVFVMSLGLLAGCGGKKTNVEELPEGTVTLTVGIPQKATVLFLNMLQRTRLLAFRGWNCRKSVHIG